MRSLKLKALATAAVVVALAGTVAGSEAAFNAQDQNPNNVYAATALYAPASLTGSPSGHDVSLTWPAGTNGSGYNVTGVNNGTSSNCSSATFAAIGTPTATSYTDTGRFTPQGTYFCYQAQTTFASWTSVNTNPTAAVQLGFVFTSATVVNGGTAGRIDPGDTITFQFNQPVNTSSGPVAGNTVCVNSAAPIGLAFGSTVTTGTCAAADLTPNLARFTAGTGTASTSARFASTYAWSNGNKTLTVTLGARTVGSANPTTTGSWALTPTTTATKVLSSTGGFHVCDTNTGGGSCLPTVASSF